MEKHKDAFDRISLEVLFNNSLDAIVKVDNNYIINAANKAFIELFGFSPDQVVGNHLDDLLNMAKPGSADRNDTDLVKSGHQFEEEAVRYNKKGQAINVLIKGIPIFADSKVVGAYVIYADISKRKQTELALRESELKFRDVVSTAPGAVYQFMLKNDGTLETLFMSEGAGIIFERSIKELLVKENLFDNLHPDDYAGMIASIKNSAETLSPWSYDFRIITRKSGVKWISGISTPRKTDKGISWTGLLIDVTNKKEAGQRLEAELHKYRAIINTTMDGFWIIDLKGHFIEINKAYCDMTGYRQEELLKMNISDLELQESAEETAKHIKKIIKQGSDFFETRHRCEDGGFIDLEISVSYLEVNGGILIAFLRNITERKKTEKAIRESEENLREAQKMARMGRWELDLENNKLHWSDTIFEIFEINRNIFGATYEAFIETIHPDDRQMVEEKYSQSLKDRNPYKLEHRLLTKGGRIKWVTEVCRTEYSDSGKALRSVGVVQDITERKIAEEQIRYFSIHDSMTGLYNRFFLEEEIKRLDTARQLPISLIMADLNGLKLVNDTYGHVTGDEMLKISAEILKQAIRAEDIVARWGGDEFVILLPQTQNEEAEIICKRITEGCSNITVEGLPISMALGTATKQLQQQNLVTTLREAEDNLYRQKLTESRSTKSAVLRALLKTLEAKSYETEVHTRRMQSIARQIGEKLNLPDAELNRLSLLITLHDIGKINISEEILTKAGPLTDDEWVVVKKHPEIGFRIARATEEFAHVAEDILAHHERWDGKGYPQGLKGSEISPLARITAVADSFEVMTNGRPYKRAMSLSEVATEFRKCAGGQFDPELVNVLLSLDISKT
jgi:diguanylate cyclase (GGDEF)-like protein/PAS domain S-box-containing protein